MEKELNLTIWQNIISAGTVNYLNGFQIDPNKLLTTLKTWKWNIYTLFQPPPALHLHHIRENQSNEDAV